MCPILGRRQQEVDRSDRGGYAQAHCVHLVKREGTLRNSTYFKLSIAILVAILLVVGATFLTAEHRPVQAALCGDAHNWRVFTPPSSDPGIPRHEFLGPPIIHDGVTSAYQYAGARSVLGDEFHGDLRLGHAPESTSEHASCEPD
jgi:hypothetical protein